MGDAMPSRFRHNGGIGSLPMMLTLRCAAFTMAAGGVLAIAAPAGAAQFGPPLPSPFAMCEAAIAAAGLGVRMPAGLTLSIARAESGRADPETRRTRPWPWTINAGGIGSFFETKEDAIAAVQALRARGVASVDVGCMQVNLRHHPAAFASLDDAFDPAVNARYAVRFLTDLHRQFGDWTQATAAYHSQTRDLGEEYVRRVLGPGAVAGLPARKPASPYGVWPPPGVGFAAYPPVTFAFGAFAPPQPVLPVPLVPLRTRRPPKG